MTTETQYEIGRFLSRQLAQSRPTDTAAASIYSPGDGVQAIVKRILVCNTDTVAANWDLFHDDDGTTYDASTQLIKQVSVSPNETYVFTDELFVDSSGNVAVATDVTAALTFTLYGDESQVRAR